MIGGIIEDMTENKEHNTEEMIETKGEIIEETKIVIIIEEVVTINSENKEVETDHVEDINRKEVREDP